MRTIKRILIMILLLALLSGLGFGGWYFFLRDGSGFTTLAMRFEMEGNYDWALRCYAWAWEREPDNVAMPLALANCYAASGNYTRCESVLWDAIEQMPEQIELYIALSQAYVAQDKLLDAAHLDEQITHPDARAAFNAARPEAPVIQPAAGNYDEDCTVSLSYSSGTAFWTLTGNYPSVETDAYTAPVRLIGQEASVYALVVDANGLVSPLASADYQVGFVNEPVTIADTALDALLRESMGWVEGVELTTNMLATVEKLTLTEDVIDLSQLPQMLHLKELDATALKHSVDWTILEGLNDLESLSLPALTVDIHALEVIGGLSQLRTLNLKGCGLTTLAPLSNLSKLESLDVTDCIVGDLSPLENLQWLKTLRLGGNAVTDVSALAGLTELEELDLSGNPLESLDALGGLTKLTKLNIASTGAGSLDALRNLTALKDLDASENQISDLAPLGGMKLLTSLNLRDNQLSSLEVLVQLTELMELDVSYNQLSDLPDFEEDCALTFLTVSHNQLTNLEGLANLARLNYVYADYNEITDLQPLTSCQVLVQVDAFENPTRVAQTLIDMGVIVHYTPVFDEETGSEITLETVEDTTSDTEE